MVIDELRIHPSDKGQFLIYTIPGLIALIPVNWNDDCTDYAS
ncbi:MAG: hypothetical protein Ct9H90mP16_10360 [Candidatus Poseidoniales archaeon]|nr:MAG: hypothetical protein Ct9H90mP16_10360 [Candidatus Poseidoniales archaeon]